MTATLIVLSINRSKFQTGSDLSSGSVILMQFLARHSIVWLLVIACAPALAQSQIDKKEPTSTVGGKVTVKGKAAQGISVILRLVNQGGPSRPYRGSTDLDGNYRIANVRPGAYEVGPDAPALVASSSESRNQMLIVTEGENVEDIDFDLIRGGVITGKITDSEGQPLIEQQVIATPETTDPNRQDYLPNPESLRPIQTDDRGVYRFFGLAPGRYRVAVGPGDGGVYAARPKTVRLKKTFYPSVAEASKATVLELSEGSEATNIDITVETTLSSSDKFSVSGSIVDAENGQPSPNVRLGLLRQGGEEGSQYLNVRTTSDIKGQFKIDDLIPGKYSLMVFPSPSSDLRASPIEFEVIDTNVAGVLLKTSRQASVSGVVVLEGPDGKPSRAQPGQMAIEVNVRQENSGSSSGRGTIVNQDGTFRLGGLEAGIASFSIRSANRPSSGFKISRVERDGVVSPRIEIKDGEAVTGMRVVVTPGNGTIRGIVKTDNGELPPGARVNVWINNTGTDQTILQAPMMSQQAMVDSRGHFLIEGVPAGSYLVNAIVMMPSSRTRQPSAKQQVNVADGITTEITITVDMKPDPNPH
jgi:hypothetical protein